MKKSFIFAFLLASALMPQAQDTVHLAGPKGNYFSNGWLDSASYRRWEDQVGYMYPGDALAKKFHTDQKVDIYGVAAILLSAWDDFDGDTATFVNTYKDTARAHSTSSLCLFQYEAPGIMQPVGDSLKVFATDRPSYYLDMGMSCPPLMTSSPGDTLGSPFPPYPVFERYYPLPQAVHDTFYAGICFHQLFSVNDFWMEWVPLYLPVFIPHNPANWNEEYAGHSIDMNNDTTWLFFQNGCGYMFVFPILAPPPSDTVTDDSLVVMSGSTLVVMSGGALVVAGDTLVVTDTLVIPLGDTVVIAGHPFVVNPGDTLVVGTGDTLVVAINGTVTVLPGSTVVVHSGSGSSSGGDDPGVAIRQTDLVYRYTAVAPNPALDRATVTSSFGLERIEVYDPQGRQMLTLPATGYRATLDLSAWPRGTYLLRIHTPLGTTTKKLLIR